MILIIIIKIIIPTESAQSKLTKIRENDKIYKKNEINNEEKSGNFYLYKINLIN